MDGTNATASEVPVLSPAALGLERGAEAVEALREAQREMARAAAVRLERVNEVRLVAETVDARLAGANRSGAMSARDRVRFTEEASLNRRSVRAEIAAASQLSDGEAENLLAMAKSLTTELTATMAALKAGDISERHVRILWQRACEVPEEDRALFEQRALAAARTLPPARLSGRLREISERLHPETAIARRRAAVEKRNVWVDPAGNGMAYLTAHLPVEQADAVMDRLENYALGISGDPHETRTLPQLRADVAVEFLIGGQVGDRTIRPTVHLTVPVLTLLGHSEEPAILEGYGPIDLETARKLTADASSFLRLLTDPVTGAILDVGRTRYTPTKEMREVCRIRDQRCRWPGCGRRAKYCELDHSLEWVLDSGPTAITNLAYLCTKHHKLKSTGRWKVKHLDQFGSLEWTSPLGQVYVDTPAVRMRGAPDTVQATVLRQNEPPPADDRIPDDLYGQWQAAFDDELAADRTAA